MKKSKFPFAALLLLALFAGVAALWVRLPPKPLHAPSSVRVEVEKPATNPPLMLEPAPPEQATPEAEQNQPVVTAPIVPEKAPVLPPGHKPEIAIVIDDMGLNLSGSQRAIKLPGYVTLSFMPYAERLDEQTVQAREAGHELLLHMPMEPIGRQDPGPGALLTTLSPEEVRARFIHALDSFEGFDGVNNHMGSRFTAYAAGMEIVIEELQKRHLFFLDLRTTAQTVGTSIAEKHGLPTISRDVFLDDSIVPDAIKAQLAATERVASRKGYAVAIGHPHENTLAALETWLPQAEKDGFEFVPVKALVKTLNQ